MIGAVRALVLALPAACLRARSADVDAPADACRRIPGRAGGR
jgi:hypothetical protein